MRVLCALLLVLFAGSVRLEDTYCFRLTWLGPMWDNSSELGNVTCKGLDLMAPCTNPLVITVDSTPPNLTYMWYTYERSQVACKLARGQVCLKYANYYNDQLERVTYLCGKMTLDGNAVTSGCEWTTKGAYRTEACACTSYSSTGIPCNSASALSGQHLVALLVVALAAVLAALPAASVFCSA
ncbi:uncharacterized protein LOC124805567 [Schistocerca piceifrons]|uniref:uncharacterized protein LOC124805567 n=1 Tax=Schistocerca piceifrons TaxID=274613 RepID=UPI001F5EB6DD|nr:uncharacterized protein LOC124805567 [Schistocerca piceifrons]